MARLRVTPAQHQGHERLYVTLPDGTSLAWYDRDINRISLVRADREADVMAALAPYATGEVTVGPPPVPTPADLDRLTLHPDDDLAPNRPGEALYAALDALPVPTPARFLRRDAREDALSAQCLVGDALDALDGAGWRVLHAVPLPGSAFIDHLAIGPAGVLAVRTLPARKRRVRIADPMVRLGRSAPVPHLRWARRAAERASLALALAVAPALVVTGATRLETLPSPPGGTDVRILKDDMLHTLARLGGVLKPAEVEAVYAAARNRNTWTHA
ncbi:nuclease-related domain-containing protein [Streptomyces fuscigenes]|uniref:nuclease-related domain-containing protein n=1 Tax=Streptomyces fuscigenes TaxID=1528880 RepID=UPI001F3391F6|nr:nuclease-related domain-containing protein [Streptomyces fuscigenes]MCF3961918.1 NERD domain-containing protein [Streptomyces fuscigenes]